MAPADRGGDLSWLRRGRGHDRFQPHHGVGTAGGPDPRTGRGRETILLGARQHGPGNGPPAAAAARSGGHNIDTWSCTRCGSNAGWPRKRCWRIPPDRTPVSLLGRGSRGGRRDDDTSLTRDDVDQVLREGSSRSCAAATCRRASAASGCRRSDSRMPRTRPSPYLGAVSRPAGGSRRRGHVRDHPFGT